MTNFNELKNALKNDNGTFILSEGELNEYTKLIAQICVSLCMKNALSGAGKNGCQHDISSIKDFFALENE